MVKVENVLCTNEADFLTLLCLVTESAVYGSASKNKETEAAFLISSIKILLNEYLGLVQVGKIRPFKVEHSEEFIMDRLRSLISEAKTDMLSEIVDLVEDEDGKLELTKEIKNHGRV